MILIPNARSCVLMPSATTRLVGGIIPPPHGRPIVIAGSAVGELYEQQMNTQLLNLMGNVVIEMSIRNQRVYNR